ncbi:MAG TPA: hypothetical protein VLL98_04815, partial [Rickettsiales bacterium]|nr:hypothetical protein [Rickettsiales bacterium]
LKFYISWREERKRLIGLFRGFDPLGIDSRAKQCNFSKRLAKKIHSKSFSSIIFSNNISHIFLSLHLQNLL